MNEKGVTYSCMCNNQIKKETAFCFLEELKNLFLKFYSIRDIQNAKTFEFNNKFRDQIKTKLVNIS